jgi:hypothetical protein
LIHLLINLKRVALLPSLVHNTTQVLLSVHDVSILPLVLALGAHGDILQHMSPLPEAAHEPIHNSTTSSQEATSAFYDTVWPEYGGAVEVQVAVDTDGTGAERWVRVLYRGQVLRLADLLLTGAEDDERAGFVRLGDLVAFMEQRSIANSTAALRD